VNRVDVLRGVEELPDLDAARAKRDGKACDGMELLVHAKTEITPQN
jgi:hypothetical protein